MIFVRVLKYLKRETLLVLLSLSLRKTNFWNKWGDTKQNIIILLFSLGFRRHLNTFDVAPYVAYVTTNWSYILIWKVKKAVRREKIMSVRLRVKKTRIRKLISPNWGGLYIVVYLNKLRLKQLYLGKQEYSNS